MISLEIFKEKGLQSDVVNARILWTNLESKREFATWVKTKVVNSPLFVVNEDWCLLDNSVKQKEGSGGHNIIEYALTLNTAKQVSLMENTLKGKEIRQYFIDHEKRSKALPELILEKTQLELRVVHFELKAAQDKLEASLVEQDLNMETLKSLFEKTRGYKPNIVPITDQIVANYQRAQAYLERRSRVCLEELWVEALGLHRSSFDRYARKLVKTIMEEIPYWEESSHTANFGEYGNQHYWYRD